MEDWKELLIELREAYTQVRDNGNEPYDKARYTASVYYRTNRTEVTTSVHLLDALAKLRKIIEAEV